VAPARLGVACALVLSSVLRIAPPAASSGAVETLSTIGGLPAYMVGQFEEAVGFVQTTSGEYLVLDRRAHTIYGVDAAKTSLRKVLQIGSEQGHVLGPAVLALSPDDTFAVADAPAGAERIQYFAASGQSLGGFYLQSSTAPRITIGPLVLNGVGSMAFSGHTFLVNRPESGALISEFDTVGTVLHQFGTLRPTGFESDADLHLALNIGIPLVDPTGGFYFVFQTGTPMFRRYDASGTLLFERHIEGSELDASIQSLPTAWPRRNGTLPLVPPLVRTAAVDRSGRLWVSLIEPFTYVYDKRGEKTRTVQFQGAGTIAAASLFFTTTNHLLVTPGCYEFAVK
jgi:hypothetical protein